MCDREFVRAQMIAALEAGASIDRLRTMRIFSSGLRDMELLTRIQTGAVVEEWPPRPPSPQGTFYELWTAIGLTAMYHWSATDVDRDAWFEFIQHSLGWLKIAYMGSLHDYEFGCL